MNANQTSIGGLQIRRLRALDQRTCGLLLAPNVCTVCTIAPDGSIHAQPVWVDTDGERVLLNSVGGRAWVRNLERHNAVTCNVINLRNPYEFVEIRGLTAAPTREGADEHIHKMAKKYLGLEEYPWMSPDQPRILIRVMPEKVVHVLPEDEQLER